MREAGDGAGRRARGGGCGGRAAGARLRRGQGFAGAQGVLEVEGLGDVGDEASIPCHLTFQNPFNTGCNLQQVLKGL